MTVAAYPDLDIDGHVTSVMSLVTDVSELEWLETHLRLLQNELETSGKKYRDFAEHAPVSYLRTIVPPLLAQVPSLTDCAADWSC